MLKIMIILPILSILFNKIKNIFLIISIIELYISLYIYIIFNNNNIEFKLYDNLLFLDLSIDSLSLGLIILTNIIFPIIFLIREKTNHFNINFLFSFLLSFLLAIFMINDIIIFYIIFELILIPIFIVVIKYGSKYKRIEAGYKLFIYTIIGSLLFLMGIIIIYNNIKNSNNNYIEYYIYSNNIEQNILIFIYLLFFFSFAIKIPIFPFHTWLPIAHSESPTTGSVILAGILLKLGIYGMIRYNITILPLDINIYISPIIITLAIISILYSSIIIFNIIDIKKIIAYSSIIHMNYMIYGLYSFNINGILGSYYSTISHGIISSGLFILIGVLYRRYHTRNILYYKGLSTLIPIFSIIFFIFIFSNLSLPITSAFPGEILTIIGGYKWTIITTIIITILLILGSGYNLLLLNRMIYGSTSIYINKYKDISVNEILTILPLIILNIILGIFTKPIIGFIYLSIMNLLL